jgi:hypothetical protein
MLEGGEEGVSARSLGRSSDWWGMRLGPSDDEERMKTRGKLG